MNHSKRQLSLCADHMGCIYFSPALVAFLKIQTLIKHGCHPGSKIRQTGSPQTISIRYTQGTEGSLCRIYLAQGFRIEKGHRAKALIKCLDSSIYPPQDCLSQ